MFLLLLGGGGWFGKGDRSTTTHVQCLVVTGLSLEVSGMCGAGPFIFQPTQTHTFTHVYTCARAQLLTL